DRLVRYLPQVGNLRIDARVLAFAVGAVALCALLSGLWPALTASRLDLQSALKEGGSTGLGARPQRATAALGMAQVALALVLLVAAGATTQAFVGMLVRPLGFMPDRITTLDAVLGPRYPTEAARVQLVDALVARTGGAAATSLPQMRQRNWEVSAGETTV